MIQRLERLAGAHRAVADHGDDAPIGPGARGGERHAERGADRGARVADAERVELAFGTARKGREPALELDRPQAVATSGQHLVRVGLVADVPDQAVVRRVEDVVQRDRQLDRAEPGGEMPAHLADRVDQELAQLRRRAARVRRRRAAAGRPGIRSATAAGYGSGGIHRRKSTRMAVSAGARAASRTARPAGERRPAGAGRSCSCASACSSATRRRAASMPGDGRIGRLVARVVAARGLAERRLRRLRRRECRPGSGTRGRRALPKRSSAACGSAPRSAAQARRHQHAGADQRAGLERCICSISAGVELASHCGEIERLAARHAGSAAGLAPAARSWRTRGRVLAPRPGCVASS